MALKEGNGGGEKKDRREGEERGYFYR